MFNKFDKIICSYSIKDLEEAFEEIKEFREIGILKKGIVRKIHAEWEKQQGSNVNLRVVEGEILFEIAKRTFEKV